MDLADPDSRSSSKDINKQQAAKLAVDFILGFIEFLLKQQVSTQKQEEIFNNKNSLLDISNLQEVSLKLRKLLIRIATGGKRDNESNSDYIYLRNIILSSDIPKEKILEVFNETTNPMKTYLENIRNDFLESIFSSDKEKKSQEFADLFNNYLQKI